MRGSKTGEYPSRRVRRPPRTARHRTRTDCQPAPSEDDADWQAQSTGYSDGFSSPAPPFSGGTPRDTRTDAKCQETAELTIASPDAFGIVAHGVKPASDCAATVLKGLALLAPSAGCSQPGPRRRTNYDRLEQQFSRAEPRPWARRSYAPEPAHAARRLQPRQVRSATGLLR